MDEEKFLNDLVLVVEECAEVIQAATKIQRFGIHDNYPTYALAMSNIDALTNEVGQLLHCIEKLKLDPAKIEISKRLKKERLEMYGPEGTYLATRPGIDT